MRNNFLFIFMIIFLLNGCALKPKMNLNDHEGEGYFVGILQPSYKIFVPMEFIVTISHDVSFFDEWYFQCCFFQHISLRCFLKKDNGKKLKELSDYSFYFVIVKGEKVNHYPNKSISLIKQKKYLRIDKIVYLKVVDKDFVKCLLDKRVSVEKYENYYLKHPKEILKLCPCKPLRKIKKRNKNMVTL